MTGGSFIVLEGADGAGHTTQAHRLAARIDAGDRLAIVTCEPSDGPIGRLIRQALRREVVLAPDALPGLFAADRLDHAERTIRRQLAEAAVVVCDRYDWSNLAYRAAEVYGRFYICAVCGWGGEPDEAAPLLGCLALATCPRCLVAPVAFAPAVLERVAWTRSLSHGALHPDLTIVLAVPPDVAAGRRQRRAGAAELYDASRMQARVCAVYARAEELRAPGEQVVVVDGTGDEDVVAERVWVAARGLLDPTKGHAPD